MSRRHASSGLPTRDRTKASPRNSLITTARVSTDWRRLSRKMNGCLSMLYSTMTGNFMVIITILFVVVLSFLLPDISQKLQATQELKSMKAVLNKISTEVKQAEVACLTMTDEICCLHCNVHDKTKESPEKMRDLSTSASHHVWSTQSEPCKVEKKIGFFRRIFHPARNTSNKEIAIMSYVYTNSFDAKEPMIDTTE